MCRKMWARIDLYSNILKDLIDLLERFVFLIIKFGMRFGEAVSALNCCFYILMFHFCLDIFIV